MYQRRIWSKSIDSTTPLFAFEKEGKIGFIDQTGKVAIAPSVKGSIDDLADFVEGYIRIGEDGLIDSTGRVTIADFSTRAEANRSFSEGLAPFTAPGKPGIRQFTPKPIYLDFPGLKGFRDKSGNIVIKPEYAEVGPFREGLARVVLDGQCYVANPESWATGTPTTGMASSCGAPPDDVTRPCGTGFINHESKLVIPAAFESARDFQEGLAAIRTAMGWGFIDTGGKLVIGPQHELVRSFRNGLAPFRANKKWGFLDRTGRIRVAPVYDEVGEFSQGLAVVTRGKQQRYIDESGNTAIKGPFVEATPFVLGLAATRTTKDKVTYIDRTGRPVFTYTLSKPY